MPSSAEGSQQRRELGAKMMAEDDGRRAHPWLGMLVREDTVRVDDGEDDVCARLRTSSALFHAELERARKLTMQLVSDADAVGLQRWGREHLADLNRVFGNFERESGSKFWLGRVVA